MNAFRTFHGAGRIRVESRPDWAEACQIARISKGTTQGVTPDLILDKKDVVILFFPI
jgi:hypothetical protein